MRIASVADVKARLSAFLKASERGPLVVTRNGRPVAVVVGVQDEDEIERLLMAYSPKLRAILDKSRDEIRKGRGVPHEQFWAELESDANKGKRRRSAPRRGKPRLS
jgi:prevent-host-death family protein